MPLVAEGAVESLSAPAWAKRSSSCTVLRICGASAEIANLYPQVMSLQGDHAGVIARLLPLVAANEAAKRAKQKAADDAKKAENIFYSAGPESRNSS